MKVQARIFHEAGGGSKELILADGKPLLSLENLKTTNGPDLYDYLSLSKSATDFLNRGILKGNLGNQSRAIHTGIDLTRYDIDVMRCTALRVLFGNAQVSTST